MSAKVIHLPRKRPTVQERIDLRALALTVRGPREFFDARPVDGSVHIDVGELEVWVSISEWRAFAREGDAAADAAERSNDGH